MSEFLVARNPDRGSSLPFILGVPLPDGPCWFKAAASYPRAHRVFCIQCAPARELDALEIVERVPVVLCNQRGKAIDLILDRSVNRRSQFITVSSGGRTKTFWQTARAARAARPGVRVPRSYARSTPTFYIDTRERYGYRFSTHGAKIARRALPVGDYAVFEGEQPFGVVERKTLSDFVNSLQSGSLSLALSELAGVAFAAIVVEGSYAQVLRFPFVRPGFLCTLIARLHVRYPNVSIQFLANRACAEEWTFRFLTEVHTDGRSMTLK